MQVKIADTTASQVFGGPPTRQLLKVSSGEFAGRAIVLLQTENNQIRFAYADRPYSAWSTLAEVTSQTADFGFDALMDDSGNVYVVYCEQTTNYIVLKKLSFSAGIWTVGDAVYVYNGGVSVAPSIARTSGGKLLVSFSRLSAGYFDIQVKSSSDSGQTWGTGPGDAGDSLRTGLPAGTSKVVAGPSKVHVVYCGTGTDLFVQSQSIAGGSWSGEFVIASGSGIDEHFDAAVSGEGLLGVVFDAQQLKYREYDGSNWSSLITLDESEVEFPQLKFENNIPVVVYLSDEGDNQSVVKYSHRATGEFSSPAILDSSTGDFESVVAYDAVSCSYADLTAASSSETAGDVFHPQTGVLLKNIGDAVYFGLSRKFRNANVILSTAGAGGAVTYSYFDGVNWKAFALVGGAFNFDAISKNLIFWSDLNSIPADWQKCTVNGGSMFWVRVEAGSAFTSGPVGSRITSQSDLRELSVGR
ncbi:MAG: hypothetical protein AB1483_04170 [Candidatus Zixiibacteriota bacterium]